jgi:hypothetical protein
MALFSLLCGHHLRTDNFDPHAKKESFSVPRQRFLFFTRLISSNNIRRVREASICLSESLSISGGIVTARRRAKWPSIGRSEHEVCFNASFCF